MNQNSGTNGNSLYDNWNEFAPKIINLMVIGIRDGNSKLILE